MQWQIDEQGRREIHKQWRSIMCNFICAFFFLRLTPMATGPFYHFYTFYRWENPANVGETSQKVGHEESLSMPETLRSRLALVVVWGFDSFFISETSR
jgi:hypothetical protein